MILTNSRMNRAPDGTGDSIRRAGSYLPARHATDAMRMAMIRVDPFETQSRSTFRRHTREQARRSLSICLHSARTAQLLNTKVRATHGGVYVLFHVDDSQSRRID